MSDDFQNLMLANQYSPQEPNYGYVNSDSGPQSGGLAQAAATDDESMAGAKGVPLVSRGNLNRADSHLQDVIDSLITQQKQQAARNNPDNGPSRAVQAAILSGLGGGGSLGGGAAIGLGRAAPYMQAQEQNYTNVQDKMDQLRLNAAQIESNRQKGLINAQTRGNIYNQKRADEAFKMGASVDENGNLVANQPAMDALRQKAYMLERAKMSAQGLDSLLPPDPTGGAQSPSTAKTSPTALSHAQAIMMAESGGDINAPNGDGGKAVGPMQLHEATAKEVRVTDRTDPAQNIIGGQAYLDKYTKIAQQQGKENPALWATVVYKDGPGYAAKWSGDLKDLSPGTQEYINKVNGYMKHGLLNDEPIPGLDDKIAAANLNPSVAPRIKAMIEGRTAPLTGFGSNSPYGIMLTNKINQIDPTYDAHRYATITDFDTGATSKIIRPINTSIAHLDTLLKYGAALDNGDTQLVNKAKNDFEAQFGKTAPTTFDAIKPIVANEVVKAIVARGGGEADRAEAQKALSNAKSPQQLKDIVTAEQALLSGQMNSMEQTYVAGTGGLTNFKQKYLTSATRQAFAPQQGNQVPAAGASGGQFPMQVKNGAGKVATVSNADELKEANAAGFK